MKGTINRRTLQIHLSIWWQS